MPNLPFQAVNATLQQLRAEWNLEVCLSPLQTSDKLLPGTVTRWFVLERTGEEVPRKLILHFDQSMETKTDSQSYLRECQKQIAKEVRSFWDGTTSEPERTTEVRGLP